MKKEDIIAFIMGKINEICDIDRESMSLDSAFMGDLDMSSFEIMTMVADLEFKYKMRFPTKDLRTIITIEDLANYIMTHTK